jgi:hypothetical protein
MTARTAVRSVGAALAAALLGACTAPKYAVRVGAEWDMGGGPVLSGPRAAAAREPALRVEAPFVAQREGLCGPAALASLLGHWGLPADMDELAAQSYSARLGGTLGFDLWRLARRRGLAALEVKGLDPAALRALLAQGVPVLVSLRSGRRGHYVLVTGWRPDTRRWTFHDGRRAHGRARAARFERAWEASGRWALVAFPPERRVSGLGAEHLQAAERAGELGRREASLWHLERAAERGSSHALWLKLGVEHHTDGRAAEAEAAYVKSIRLAPSVPDAYNNLALLLAAAPDRLKEAERLARDAVSLSRLFPSEPSRLPYALDTLGLVLEKQRRRREAADVFRQALEQTPAEHPAAAELRRKLRSAAP